MIDTAQILSLESQVEATPEDARLNVPNILLPTASFRDPMRSSIIAVGGPTQHSSHYATNTYAQSNTGGTFDIWVTVLGGGLWEIDYWYSIGLSASFPWTPQNINTQQGLYIEDPSVYAPFAIAPVQALAVICGFSVSGKMTINVTKSTLEIIARGPDTTGVGVTASIRGSVYAHKLA